MEEDIMEVKMTSLREWLSARFNELSKDNVRVDTRLTEFDKQNCHEHNKILDGQAKYRDEMYFKFDILRQETMPKEKYNEFYGVYNNQVNKYDKAIEERKMQIDLVNKRIDSEKEERLISFKELEGSINKLTVYFTIASAILWVAISFITDYIKMTYFK